MTTPTPETPETPRHGPLVTVLRDRRIPGASSEGVIVAQLGEALARSYGGDAHFQQCVSSHGRRVVGSDVGHAAITMTSIAFDIDAPGHTPTPEWRAELRQRVEARCSDVMPGGYFYETRGGARLVYELDEPFEIWSDGDAARWTRHYLEACAVLASAGIPADRSCADFTRLYRLPRATRDPGGKPEERPTLGDPMALGCFELPKLAPLPENASPHVPGPPGPARAQNATRELQVERGAFYEALSERGDVLRAKAPGVFVIRCPRDSAHNTGEAGDGSTLLYASNALGGPGAIHCKHASCAGVKGARAWRREISKGCAPMQHAAMRPSRPAAGDGV